MRPVSIFVLQVVQELEYVAYGFLAAFDSNLLFGKISYWQNTVDCKPYLAYAVISQCRRILGLIATLGGSSWRAIVHFALLFDCRSCQSRGLGELLAFCANHRWGFWWRTIWEVGQLGRLEVWMMKLWGWTAACEAQGCAARAIETFGIFWGASGNGNDREQWFKSMAQIFLPILPSISIYTVNFFTKAGRSLSLELSRKLRTSRSCKEAVH